METRPRPSSAPWELPAALAALAVAGACVFHGAMRYFFAQDDFAGLARAAGELPRLAGPWRWVSGQLYFDVMRALAGLHAAPYHAVSLGAHVACAVLLVQVLRARVSFAAALAGAFVFVTHPALFTALYSVSGIGEILALLFALAAILAARARGPARWGALPLFALSLLCKESLLLLPVVVALDRRARAGAGRSRARTAGRAPLVAALAAVSAAYLAVFLTHDVFGVWKALPAQAPYALAFDRSMVDNLLTYAGWTANFTVFGVHAFSDAVDPLVTAWGAGTLLALAAGTVVPALRRRGWGLGAAAFAAFLLPVLPLPHHTYHYYLYAPLAGVAACVAAAADLARSALAPARRGAMVFAWAVLVVGGLLTWNGAALVSKVETMPFALPVLRSDPTVDRALIAEHLRDGLAAAGLAPGDRVMLWSPSSMELELSRGRDVRSESYWERNVRSALFDTVGVRLLFPMLASAEFVHDYHAGDPGVRWALYAPDGRVAVMSSAEVEAALRAGRVPP